jgi:hypothetical protein
MTPIGNSGKPSAISHSILAVSVAVGLGWMRVDTDHSERSGPGSRIRLISRLAWRSTRASSSGSPRVSEVAVSFTARPSKSVLSRQSRIARGRCVFAPARSPSGTSHCDFLCPAASRIKSAISFG